MSDTVPQPSWFGDPHVYGIPTAPSPEAHRIWMGFMTARLTVAVVLLLVQLTLLGVGNSHSQTQLVLSTLYLGATIISRFAIRPQALGGALNPLWGLLVGIDIVMFAAMQVFQNTGINFTPLFALPILFASVLGTLLLALGTAAGVTLLLLIGSYWASLQSLSDATPHLVQAALSGAGYFAIAFLAHQLGSRLVAQSENARQQQQAMTIQKQVNELVIDSLPDGVLIVDTQGWIRAANPAAREMLGLQANLHGPADLKSQIGWAALLKLAQTSLGTGHPVEETLRIERPGHGGRQVRTRTRLAQPLGAEGESLCVLFLQDQRELEARLRTEKLASMGRMSAAVAHEIRNPLAAISQANALLGEELHDPRLTRLSTMVDQNARRLGKIVDDILDVSRVHPNQSTLPAPQDVIALHDVVRQCVTEWNQQNPHIPQPLFETQGPEAQVLFDADHLRRVLFNLLDNARRHTAAQAHSIQVICDTREGQAAAVAVWSEGPPLEPSVQSHLFEPFFSSDSRSSGLGLFICRELCVRHGASIHYRRIAAVARAQGPMGNAFVFCPRRAPGAPDGSPLLPPGSSPWQATLY